MSFDLFRSLASRLLAGDDLREFLAEVDAHQAADGGDRDAAPEPIDVPANTGGAQVTDPADDGTVTHVGTSVPADAVPPADHPGTATVAPAEVSPDAAQAAVGNAPAPAGVDEPGSAQPAL